MVPITVPVTNSRDFRHLRSTSRTHVRHLPAVSVDRLWVASRRSADSWSPYYLLSVLLRITSTAAAFSVQSPHILNPLTRRRLISAQFLEPNDMLAIDSAECHVLSRHDDKAASQILENISAFHWQTTQARKVLLPG